LASFKAYLNNNAPFLNARDKWQAAGSKRAAAQARWEAAKETDANYDSLLNAFKAAQEAERVAKVVKDTAEDKARTAYNKIKDEKKAKEQKKKDAVTQKSIDTVQAEVDKYTRAGLAVPADKQEELKSLKNKLGGGLTTTTTTTSPDVGTANVATGTTPTQVGLEDFLKNLNDNPKAVNQVKSYLGITNLDGVLDYETISKIYSKEKEIETLVGIRGPIDRLTYYAQTKGTGTGAGGTSIDRSTNIFTDAEAIAVVQKLYKTLLNAEPTPDEQLKLAKKLQDAQKKNPVVIKSKTVNGVREAVTTGGLDPEDFLTDEIKKDPRYSKKKEQALSTSRATLAATARANGLDLDKNFGNQVDDFLNRINNGEDIKNIQNVIRKQSRLFLPESVRNSIDADTDLTSAFGIYVNDYAKSKGVSPDQVDINEVIPLAVTDKGFAPIAEFRKAKKKLPWWANSPEASDEVFQGIGQVFSNFGIMEI